MKILVKGAVKALAAYFLLLNGIVDAQNIPSVAKDEKELKRKTVEYGVRSIPIWPLPMDINDQYPSVIPNNIKNFLEKFRANLSQNSQKDYMKILYLNVQTSDSDPPPKKWYGVFLGIEVVSQSGEIARYMFAFDKDEELFFKEMLNELKSKKKEPSVTK